MEFTTLVLLSDLDMCGSVRLMLAQCTHIVRNYKLTLGPHRAGLARTLPQADCMLILGEA